MRLALERRRPPATALVEVVTPRASGATITPVENLLAAAALGEPFALEVAATRHERAFLVRAPGADGGECLLGQLAAAYPQAGLRPLDPAAPAADPARPRAGEAVAACALHLRAPACLPLRTFADAEVAADRSPQADPILGVLAALGDLPDGWRALAQLVLRPAPDDWSRGYLPLALDGPAAARARVDGPSPLPVLALAGGLGAAALGLQAHAWYLAGAWAPLAVLGLGAGGALVAAPRVAGLLRRPVLDPRLVREKVGRPAYLAELRLAVFASAGAPPAELGARLARAAAGYRQFNLAAGNGFAPRPLRVRPGDLASLAHLSGRGTPVLTTRELAGLWHLPQGGAEAPLLARTAARELLPPPGALARGCRIGVAEQQGRRVPVALPDELLRRHLLLVAKTRRGKSALLLRLARHLMGRPGALVLVDPHRDLAEAALGCVPQHRRDDVVYLDLGDARRSVGLNLIDAGLGWDRDSAVANALTVFRRQFDRFWGPRMEDAFRFALLTLFEANGRRAAVNDDARADQHTVLEVPLLFTDPVFRRGVLAEVVDRAVLDWWAGYFDQLDRRLQSEVINPVQTKVQRFLGSLASRRIVGQARSTVDPRAWIHDGSIVLVNTAKGTVGEDTAALVGATLLNLVGLAVGAQAALPAARRRAASLIVDEFHAMPGADYEAILAELAKYGASLVLATQSLARLDALDRDQGRALRATVFANLDGLFAFHCSAEDARYLVRELGGAVDEEDLVALGEHRCYARLSAGGERLPVCSVHLAPPPTPDPRVARRLAARSSRRHARAAAWIDRRRRERLAAIAGARATVLHGGAGAGVAGDAAGTTGKNKNKNKDRSDHRPRRVPDGQRLLPFETERPDGPGELDQFAEAEGAS